MVIRQAMKLENIWHALPIEKVFEILNTRKEGLSQEEAKERLSLYGFNEIKKEKEKSILLLFLQQFNNPLILLLVVATLFSALIGEVLDAIVILVVVLASTGLGFIEEYRSEKAVHLLKKLTLPESHVIRDGNEISIPTREIVVGDIVVLRAGDRVPCCCNWFFSYRHVRNGKEKSNSKKASSCRDLRLYFRNMLK